MMLLLTPAFTVSPEHLTTCYTANILINVDDGLLTFTPGSFLALTHRTMFN